MMALVARSVSSRSREAMTAGMPNRVSGCSQSRTLLPQASTPDTNNEFNHLNANLVVPADGELILNAAAERLHQRGAPPLRRCS
jgi:hypothetical protein